MISDLKNPSTFPLKSFVSSLSFVGCPGRPQALIGICGSGCTYVRDFLALLRLVADRKVNCLADLKLKNDLGQIDERLNARRL